MTLEIGMWEGNGLKGLYRDRMNKNQNLFKLLLFFLEVGPFENCTTFKYDP